jgi:hypothetical protein
LIGDDKKETRICRSANPCQQHAPHLPFRYSVLRREITGEKGIRREILPTAGRFPDITFLAPAARRSSGLAREVAFGKAEVADLLILPRNISALGYMIQVPLGVAVRIAASSFICH